MQVRFDSSPLFKQLMSGDVLNKSTTGAFLGEVLKETIGPSGIAVRHFNAGQSKWPRLAASTLRDKRKRSKQKFRDSGRVHRAISTALSSGTLRSFGSSADVAGKGQTTAKRLSQNGIYSQIRVTPGNSSITIGFNGRYGHSAAFNKVRRDIAKQRGAYQKGAQGAKAMQAVRKAVSVEETERRMRQINEQRKALGLKTWRKTQARGTKGFSSTKRNALSIAKGAENLAYADIVQRGKFKGLARTSPRMRRGVKVQYAAKYGVARPLLPYISGDEAPLQRALERSMRNLAAEINK